MKTARSVSCAVMGISLVVTASACAPVLPRSEFLAKNLAPRASFDLQCPADQLSFTNLGPPVGDAYHFFVGSQDIRSPEVAMQQGVTGCGKRGVYVYTPTSGWILNADDGKSPAAK